MSSEIAIKVNNVSKCYHIYDHPRDRLRQFFLPGIQRYVGRKPKSYFRESWALHDTTFQVGKGETIGIIGRNGSGKSTLLQIICGTLNQTHGTVETKGRVAALLELGSGFNAEFTGRENVYLNASMFGLNEKEIDERFDDIASFADIGEYINQPVKTYSSGMLVRLAFSVVAHVNTDILVIDEALAVGDAYFTQKCMRFLRRFRENGTLLFVSHDAAAVIGLCDSAIWLDKGEMKAHNNAKVVSEAYLASLYDGSKPSGKIPVSIKDAQIKRMDVVNDQAVVIDPRADLINKTILRNDLQVFRFIPGASSDFGLRGAEISEVAFLGENGKPLLHIIGGEIVQLRIGVVALKKIISPIIGFSVKDRLGQVLFGDNTYITYHDTHIVVESGKMINANFVFQMPILPAGDYSIAVAIASGTQTEHVQHHWLHDALIFKSLASSVSTGLVGIPMKRIELV